ncbi:MAG: hypothetical protein JWM24_454 [Solirubrobacterales bacterium]|nr:hypothetical protein [Solirubrobacterales bacterium]
MLDIIWGIAAIGDSKFFTADATYIVSGLHTWGGYPFWSLAVFALAIIIVYKLAEGPEGTA